MPISHSLSTVEPIDHRAHQPSSLSTSGLLSGLLSLSACFCGHTVYYVWKYTYDQQLFVFWYSEVRLIMLKSNHEVQTVGNEQDQINFQQNWIHLHEPTQLHCSHQTVPTTRKEGQSNFPLEKDPKGSYPKKNEIGTFYYSDTPYPKGEKKNTENWFKV